MLSNGHAVTYIMMRAICVARFEISEENEKRMRSGGISDEDALNRPFPFTLVVNNHDAIVS